MTTCDVTFLGTATTLLRLGPFTLLTDPNFLRSGQRAYLGYGMWSRRRTEPALQPHDLPRLDAIVLSHLHGDHFDRVARRDLPSHLRVVTTPQAAQRLHRWGWRNVDGLRTWQTHHLASGDSRLRITAVPAQHGPRLVDLILPETMGSMLDFEDGNQRLRVYITGDTLYSPRLERIPERFPDVDAMLLHLGGARIAGIPLTAGARQGVRIMDLIRPRLTVPLHYEDYPVFREPLAPFLDSARQGDRPPVRVAQRGATVSLLPEPALTNA